MKFPGKFLSAVAILLALFGQFSDSEKLYIGKDYFANANTLESFVPFDDSLPRSKVSPYFKFWTSIMDHPRYLKRDLENLKTSKKIPETYRIMKRSPDPKDIRPDNLRIMKKESKIQHVLPRFGNLRVMRSSLNNPRNETPKLRIMKRELDGDNREGPLESALVWKQGLGDLDYGYPVEFLNEETHQI